MEILSNDVLLFVSSFLLKEWFTILKHTCKRWKDALESPRGVNLKRKLSPFVVSWEHEFDSFLLSNISSDFSGVFASDITRDKIYLENSNKILTFTWSGVYCESEKFSTVNLKKRELVWRWGPRSPLDPQKEVTVYTKKYEEVTVYTKKYVIHSLGNEIHVDSVEGQNLRKLYALSQIESLDASETFLVAIHNGIVSKWEFTSWREERWRMRYPARFIRCSQRFVCTIGHTIGFTYDNASCSVRALMFIYDVQGRLLIKKNLDLFQVFDVILYECEVFLACRKGPYSAFVTIVRLSLK